MRIVDAHCHLESPELYPVIDKILSAARDSGIVKLITSTTEPHEWEISKQTSEKYQQVEFANGVHPWYIKEEYYFQLDRLYESANDGAVAIGEIGLDKRIDHIPFETQIKFFEKQLSIANDIKLPVVLHCRSAFNEMMLSIKKIGVPYGGIIHSFSGSEELADQFIRLGLSFSIGGILTYRINKKRSTMMKRIYPDHFMLETDSPDISPVEKPERPNTPSNILYNLKAAAEILGISEEKIAEKTTENAERIFKLGL